MLICISIILVALLALALYSHIAFYNVEIQGLSMVPTLAHHDRVLLWRHYPHRLLRPNLLIVFEYPLGQLMIKRLIGLPGDTIKFPEQPDVVNDPASVRTFENGICYRVWDVPPYSIFVKSDGVGGDSRNFGFVALENVLGVVIWKLPSRVHVQNTAPILSDTNIVSSDKAQHMIVER